MDGRKRPKTEEERRRIGEAVSRTLKGKPKSEQHKAALRAAHASPETKARLRHVAHTTWHTNKGVTKSGCAYCETQVAMVGESASSK